MTIMIELQKARATVLKTRDILIQVAGRETTPEEREIIRTLGEINFLLNKVRKDINNTRFIFEVWSE